jgi:hypothetical protein
VPTLGLIGFWRNDEYPEYPHPGDWIDPLWDRHERGATHEYLTNGTVLNAHVLARQRALTEAELSLDWWLSTVG